MIDDLRSTSDDRRSTWLQRSTIDRFSFKRIYDRRSTDNDRRSTDSDRRSTDSDRRPSSERSTTPQPNNDRRSTLHKTDDLWQLTVTFHFFIFEGDPIQPTSNSCGYRQLSWVLLTPSGAPPRRTKEFVLANSGCLFLRDLLHALEEYVVTLLRVTTSRGALTPEILLLW